LSDNKLRENKVSETCTSVISVSEVQPHFAYRFSILVQFCVGYMDIMLLSIYEFGENRLREGPTTVTGINEISFTNVS
jgi:hypothetical protein